ncbi:DUF5710 domain-containing protein [Actinokineospora sp. NBRC 105648]|uniref:DUF5710 domain-containing protein n=1 Tax=Actinokineospora sp. NBRC 105648 TaxID=3032206 RepID=UPI0024A00BFE|nr:DUF5710 domain-containing protein [Actinokineospora sp. NBRC 105648]GLZ36880.1 hypothetical protein Acsp05_05050 [Actinokineospora sp. NBRC 105648]
MAERVWLDVPYRDKDEAKALGARWDPTGKRWYAPRAGVVGLARWEALPEVPDLLPGEDRGFGAGLFVDLVPSSCWFTNVRSCVDQRDWERLRRMVTKRAGQVCEACARREDPREKRWLEVHERWSYDETRHVQALRRLICLCTDCHRSTHFGLAQLKGLADDAFTHLMAVAGLSAAEADIHVGEAFSLWEERSKVEWALDLSILMTSGITVVQPPAAAARPDAARAALSLRPSQN